MLNSSTLSTVVRTIIEHQIILIGPLAIEQANKVTGIKINEGENLKVAISASDPDRVLTELVGNYEKLFGKASIEVCKDAVREVKPPLPREELPAILQ